MRVFVLLGLAVAAAACSAPVDGSESVGTSEGAKRAGPTPDDNTSASAAGSATDSGAASSPDTCNVPASQRPRLPPTPTPAMADRIHAWKAQSEAYQAIASVLGRACVTSADCATGDANFPGRCNVPYYGQAQCTIDNAPSAPKFTCADYTCPTNYECEDEAGGSVACVEHRNCGESGGGGRNRGGR